jgi:hypothetical protein
MISDCDKRSSIKSLRSASLVSSIFDSATSIIHPLEPGVEIEIESPGTPERRSIFDSGHLSSHKGGPSGVGRSSISGRTSDYKKSAVGSSVSQHKR